MSMHMSHVNIYAYIIWRRHQHFLCRQTDTNRSQVHACGAHVAFRVTLRSNHDMINGPQQNVSAMKQLVREQWRLAKRQTWSAGAPPSVQRRVSLSTNCERGKHSV